MKNTPNTASPIISLEAVSYSVPTSDEPRMLLDEINLTLHAGEWLVVVGTNGSGKSTLSRVIAGLYKPTSGVIRYPAGSSPDSGRVLPMIFQNPDTHLLGETLYEEVGFGLEYTDLEPEAIHRRILQSLETVDLLPLANARVDRLSGGQKQLLSAAGCLALRPPLLLCDEATSMLDPLSRESLLGTVREQHRAGTGIVWITQLLDELAYADRVVGMDAGRIVFDGPPRDFFYREGERGATPCEQLDFIPPYAVATAQAWMRRGAKLDPLPLTPAELAEAVRRHL